MYWTRDVVARRVLTVAGGDAVVLYSDPEVSGDPLQADQARGFIEVEAVVGTVSLLVYRYGGATSEALQNLDDGAPVLTATSADVYRIDWDEPLPACIQTRVDVVNSGMSLGSVAFRVLQTSRTRQ